MSGRAFSHSAITSALILVVGLVTGVLAARILGPQDRGYLGMIVFWPQFFAGFARLPYAGSIVVDAQRGGRSGALQRTARLLRYATRNTWIAVVAYAPIMMVATWFVFADQPKHILWFAWIFGVTVLLSTYQYQVFQGALAVKKDFGAINVLRLSLPVGYLSFAIVFCGLGLGLTGFVAAIICGYMMGYLAWFFAIGGNAKDAGLPSDTRTFMKTTLSFHALTLVGVLATQVDRTLLLPTSSPEAIGQYFVALTMTAPIQAFIGPALLTVALPSLAALAGRQRTEASLRLLRLTHAASIAAAVTVAIVAPFAAPVLFGKEFASAGLLTSALAIAGYPLGVRQAIAQIFKVENSWKPVIATELLYILTFALTYAAAMAWGASWPVVPAFAAGNICAVALYAVLLRRKWPDVRTVEWAVPRPSTFLEVGQIGLAGLKRN